MKEIPPSPFQVAIQRKYPNEPVEFTVQPSARYRRSFKSKLLERAGRPPGPVRRLKDMTPEEITRIEQQLGAKVRRAS